MMALINSTPYKQIIPSLPTGAGLSETVFTLTTLATKYTLETKQWLDGSYMNPNVLLNYLVNIVETLLYRLKFLGITKKKGAEDSKILKNAWIALHMQGLSAHQWADEMFKKDTPGKEIAVYVLCNLYKHHCIVFTSQKAWCMMEPTSPLTED